MINLKILPRQSGKTLELIDIFKKSSETTLFVTPYKEEQFKHDYRLRHKNIVSDVKYDPKIKLIILDEFLFLDKRVYEDIKNYYTDIDIIGYSSVKNIYKVKNFMYVKDFKHLGIDYLIENYPYSKRVPIKELDELYHSFITDNCNLYIDDVPIRKNNTPWGDYSFKKEFLNIIFKL